MLRKAKIMKILSKTDIDRYFSIKCHYSQGMTIYNENDLCDRIGLVIQGELELIHYTFSGEVRTLARLKKNDVFGDFLINSTSPYYPGDLIAVSDVDISFLEKKDIQNILKKSDRFRDYYLSQLSEKAIKLNQHNKILLQSNLREKINMWLTYQAHDLDTNKVPIPSKEYLASYFNVARPSLSRELANMKIDGLIDYNRSYIIIL